MLDVRAEQARAWVLAQQSARVLRSWLVASADASFRRYFRATFTEGASLIVMDAPPEHEDVHSFLQVAELLSSIDAPVPKRLAHDIERGFVLLEDFGDETFQQAIGHCLENLPADIERRFAGDSKAIRALYLTALDELVAIQKMGAHAELPRYDASRLMTELLIFPEWYVKHHCATTLTPAEADIMTKTFNEVVERVMQQPYVVVHRDYHSRNLMVRPNERLGIIDFQDAVNGPITYDLVSLLKDAYLIWDEEHTLDWLIRYWEKARQAGLPIDSDFARFFEDYEWMGVQRHLKILGVFARLCYRDNKAAYLESMPTVSHYLRSTCQRYAALHPLLNILNRLEHIDVSVAHTL